MCEQDRRGWLENPEWVPAATMTVKGNLQSLHRSCLSPKCTKGIRQKVDGVASDKLDWPYCSWSTFLLPDRPSCCVHGGVEGGQRWVGVGMGVRIKGLLQIHTPAAAVSNVGRAGNMAWDCSILWSWSARIIRTGNLERKRADLPGKTSTYIRSPTMAAVTASVMIHQHPSHLYIVANSICTDFHVQWSSSLVIASS